MYRIIMGLIAQEFFQVNQLVRQGVGAYGETDTNSSISVQYRYTFEPFLQFCSGFDYFYTNEYYLSCGMINILNVSLSPKYLVF